MIARDETYIERVIGIVRIAQRDSDTFGKDLANMTTRRLTFSDALESPEFMVMSRQRLTMVRRETFHQLDRVGL